MRSGATWSQQAKLVPNDGAPNDWFGSAVSISGETALIGAFAHDDNGTDSGSAYVFIRNGTVWGQQAKLLPKNGIANDHFGHSVSISDDVALVGAWTADVDANVNQGAAYMFVRSGGLWTEEKRLLAGDGASSDLFGTAVSLSGDTALVGAHCDDDNGGQSPLRSNA